MAHKIIDMFNDIIDIMCLMTFMIQYVYEGNVCNISHICISVALLWNTGFRA